MWKQLWIKVWRIWDLITVNSYEKLLSSVFLLASKKKWARTQEVDIFGSRVFELIFLNFFLSATKLICILCTVSINTIFLTPTSFPYNIWWLCPHSLTPTSPVPHAYAAGPNNSTIRHPSGNGKVGNQECLTSSSRSFLLFSLPEQEQPPNT